MTVAACLEGLADWADGSGGRGTLLDELAIGGAVHLLGFTDVLELAGSWVLQEVAVVAFAVGGLVLELVDRQIPPRILQRRQRELRELREVVLGQRHHLCAEHVGHEVASETLVRGLLPPPLLVDVVVVPPRAIRLQLQSIDFLAAEVVLHRLP